MATVPPPTPTSPGVPLEPFAPSKLYRLGTWCARRPWRVLAVWLLVLVASVAANRAIGGSYEDDFTLPGTSVNTGSELLKEHKSGAGGTSVPIVLHTGSGTLADHKSDVTEVRSSLEDLNSVLSVSDPFATPGAVTKNQQTAYITVRFSSNPLTFDKTYLDGVDAAVAPLRADQVEVEYGGQLGQLAKPKGGDRVSEIIGLGVALLVLLIGFGSLVAALFPLLSAVIALLCGISLLGLLAAVFTFGAASPTIATMMGLGVGLDYALFLTTRYRKLLHDSPDAATAAGRTVSTSGRAVVVAAVTVAIALAGLYASGIVFIGTLGAAAAVTVIVSAAASLTLAPALLGLVGTKIDRWHVRTPVDEPDTQDDVWARWAGAVKRRPKTCLVTGVLMLGILGIPALSIDLGHLGAGNDASDTTSRRAFDLMTDGFGPGSNGPLTVVVKVDQKQTPTSADRLALSDSVRDVVADNANVASVGAAVSSPDNALFTVSVTPRTGPQDDATADLAHTLQDTTLPKAVGDDGAQAYVTGTTAGQIAFTDIVVERLPLIIGVVAAAAFLLLLLVFRSVLIAVSAAILNMLSIAAAYGVVVAVFQWGWGGSWIGVHETVPIESYVPMMMFAIVFGLSMDYEVFLLSRVREAWIHTGDNDTSIATGLSSTARVITSAALIMTSVFLAFLLSDSVVIKMISLGLAVSVIVDATVVRLILVPATMYLFKGANWWIPRWLDRILPHFDPERPSQPAPATAKPVHTAPTEET
ncbi:MMPL family transporter [Streptomyces sp. AK02-01A]|uniref:MMPL family transporter n=1 Tax=Streptomyces sp. AK02-01A TaxID=3028648 RepID=UPI0029A5D54D|nr:MMPL family transporter [Streptomyces sp. AK02-01A]MDX3855691.1 MMPL family transporter [Streptomyces sp. AK02-01A]